MRKLILSTMVTLDGFAAGPDGGLDWVEIGDDEFDGHMADVLRGIDAMIFGRVAYELLAGYWPSVGSDPSSRPVEVTLGGLMNTIPKLVVTRSPSTPLDWTPASRLGDDLAAEVTELKDQPGKDIALFAGATIAAALMQLDLIDEYRIMVFPVILGAGQPLFADGHSPRSLELLDTRVFESSGVVVLRYRPAGAS